MGASYGFGSGQYVDRVGGGGSIILRVLLDPMVLDEESSTQVTGGQMGSSFETMDSS